MAELPVRHLGLAIPYAEGMATMRAAMDAIDDDGPVLLLLEHAPVVTITRQSKDANILTSKDALAASGIQLIETDRGGDVTFHGAGQLVGYPIVRLPRVAALDGRVDLLAYLRDLQAALLSACERLGVGGCHIKPKMTGVWVASDKSAPSQSWPGDEKAKKLVAIGVGVRQGVTRHGFALNVTTDLEKFTDHIIPCGLAGRGVTSLERELAVLPAAALVQQTVAREIGKVFSRFL